VSYSYYEVFTNAQRAFSGLGFPYGADEDAAYIISWLEAFELDGIHLFSSIQKKIDSNFNGALDNNKLTNTINLEKKSCLMIGPGLIDFLNFHTAKNNQIYIEFQNCSDPLFLIPLFVFKSKFPSSLIPLKDPLIFSEYNFKLIFFPIG